MKILILGAGAVGGYFGALLQNNGIDVTFLVRERRAAQLKKNGLKVISQLGDFIVHPKMISSIKPSDKFDLVIISCKAYALNDALKSLAPLHSTSYILPLLNGLSHYQKLKGFFGKERILGGFAHLSTVLDENGHIVHLNRLQVLKLGALETTQEEFIKELRELLLPKAPFIFFSDNIKKELWQKLIFIATAAAATCLMQKPLGAIASKPAGAQSIADSFKMNCEAAAAAGYQPDEEWKNTTLCILLDPNSAMTSSLLRDMKSGKAVELSILKDMVLKNRTAGLYNKLLESALQHLQSYESKRHVEIVNTGTNRTSRT